MNATKLFAREIDTIEDQIAALRARLAQLKEVEAYANTAIASVAEAIRKIEYMDGESLDKFQDAIARLFPTEFIEQHAPVFEPEPESEYLEEPEETDDEEPEIITHTSPHGSFEIIKIAESVAYCRNNLENSIQCAYAGFNNKLRAEQWGKHMIDRHLINRFQIRAAQRLEGFKYELKMWNINIDSIKVLAEKDLSRVPGQASFPEVEEAEFKIGNWVKYDFQTLQISEVYSDGTLSLETPDGYLIAHKSEVEPAFKKPSNWHPFSELASV